MRLLIEHEDGTASRPKVCGECVAELAARGKLPVGWRDEQVPEELHWAAEDRYSAGAYAGHYCDRHWEESGYRKDLPNIMGGMTENEIEAFDYREDSLPPSPLAPRVGRERSR